MSTTLPVYHTKACAVFVGGECSCRQNVMARIYCPNERCINHTIGWIPRVERPRKCPHCQKSLWPHVETAAVVEGS